MSNNQEPDLSPADKLFGELYPDILKPAAQGANSSLGSGLKHLDLEIVNDVLLIFWNQLQAGKTITNPGRWAYKVARNLGLRCARIEGRYAFTLEEQLDATEATNARVLLMPLDERSPARCTEQRERAAARKKLLDTFFTVAKEHLDPDEWRLFECKFVWRLAGDEIARELGVKPAAFRKRWSRMMEKLRNRVREFLRGEPLCREFLAEILNSEDVPADFGTNTFRYNLEAGGRPEKAD